MNASADTSWALHPAMATLARVAQHRDWLRTDAFARYGAAWVKSGSVGGGSRIGVNQDPFTRALTAQWFHPLTILSTSTVAALRSAATSLADEVLPPIFSYDIPHEGIAFLPTAIQGAAHSGLFGISVLAWTRVRVGRVPAVFVTAWVGDDVHQDPDIADLRISNALSQGAGLTPRYLLKHAEPILHGIEVTYGLKVHNAHREETTPIEMVDPDPASLTHRLLYALWSMIRTGALVEDPDVPLLPQTARRYPAAHLKSMYVADIPVSEALLTVRKDRVVDLYDNRIRFVWNISSPRGGRVI